MLVRCLKKVIPGNLRFSTLAEPITTLEDFRTNECDPACQTEKHIGRFYRIEPEVKKVLFTHGGLPKSFEKQIKTFGETCLMIREPALEVINYQKQINLSNPAVRYVLYGKDGVGKSLTLAHLIHYGYSQDFIIVHVPWVPNWFKKTKEIANSSTQEGHIDLPFDAATWLLHFKLQNTQILTKLDLKTSRDYVWNQRETTSEGSTLLNLIEHGITRIKFASETITALISEIKKQSTDGKCKTMVAIDGYNALFYPKTRIVSDSKVKITPEKVTLTKPFIDITNYDWCNGFCVLAVDRIALTEEKFESYLPRYQLGKEGFEHLDPFIPIKVDNYSDLEYQNCIDYYVNRRWIQNTSPGFDDELKYLSNKNPYLLMNKCIAL